MQKITCRLTVTFQEPYWVGLYERVQDGKLEVSKITFGAEPKDWQVYQYLLENWRRLRFSPPVRQEREEAACKNPKRLQREITRHLSRQGIGTKSQQALQLQREEGKLARKTRTKEQREAEKQRQFRLRQEKKREKKRGH